MLHGWKAQIHHLTRKRSFLIRTSLIILVAGFTIGCLAQWLRVGLQPPAAHRSEVSLVAQRMNESWRRLESSGKAEPRELLRWLRQFFTSQEALSEELGTPKLEAAPFLESGRLFSFDVRAMIAKHAREGMERHLFSDFVLSVLAPGDDKGKAALERIKQVAAQNPAVPFANEMLGHVWLVRDQDRDALSALVREGAFDDAKAARENALRLAIELKDAKLLASLMQQPRWLEAANSWMRSRIGAITGDVWMQWKGLIGHQMETVRWGMLALTLFATGLWYVILTQWSDRVPWRWSRPILPVLAGVCSVWPTLIVLAYQEYHLGLTAEAPFPQDLWYYLAGVGLREELCKLALFAVFLPWLLWKRSEGLALLTGAFVGLGFSLEENIQYYGAGGGIAWTRFLTANFMHLSMTAITSHALYEMLRTRFGHAEKFVATFFAIVVAHGLYDYVAVSDLAMAQLMGIDIFSIIILALLANHFFDLLAATTRSNTGIVSPASVFLIGSALLIAVMFVIAGLTTDKLSGISAVGLECASVAPVVFVFWRKFEVR